MILRIDFCNQKILPLFDILSQKGKNNTEKNVILSLKIFSTTVQYFNTAAQKEGNC